MKKITMCLMALLVVCGLSIPVMAAPAITVEYHNSGPTGSNVWIGPGVFRALKGVNAGVSYASAEGCYDPLGDVKWNGNIIMGIGEICGQVGGATSGEGNTGMGATFGFNVQDHIRMGIGYDILNNVPISSAAFVWALK